MPGFTFSKPEKLKSKKLIAQLFEEGNYISKYPLRLIYINGGHHENIVKVAVSVPKRIHKTAVTRNLLKRRMREAYRLNKHILYADREQNMPPVSLIFIYTGREVEKSDKIRKSMITLLEQLKTNLFT